jgi:hydroxyethylthiazole kinase-like uncharacterized protein yjeF
MSFLSTQALRDLDARALATGQPLMARATRGLARELLFLAEGRPASALILAGPGNNGGDGLGLAIHLLRAGWRVQVWAACGRDSHLGDARDMRIAAEAAGVPIAWKPTSADWPGDVADFPLVDWVVDALLGTGTAGAPRGVLADAVRLAQGLYGETRVVAVDLPSGFDADLGRPHDPALCVRADHCLTLGAAKKGFQDPGAGAWTGSVSVVGLGFDETDLHAAADGEWRAITRASVAASLPKRQHDGHKGSHGHVLVIGGSPGMTGAVGMAALAALRGGAGLATVLAPVSCAATLDAAFPEIMVIAGAEGRERTLTPEAWNQIESERKRFDAILIGPGMRANGDTETLVRKVLFDSDVPLVLDADALNVVAGRSQWMYRARIPLTLTPHPGELARLLGCTIAEVQADRAAAVLRAQAECNCSVVLKGAGTRVAGPGGQRWINLNGNPGLGTAGSGDILAGLLAALLAQGMARDAAVPAAIFLHGRAGDLAAQRLGQRGMIAGDLLAALPPTLLELTGR